MGEVSKILVRKTERKRPLMRLRWWWEDNTVMHME
jgi:hypothetical protein